MLLGSYPLGKVRVILSRLICIKVLKTAYHIHCLKIKPYICIEYTPYLWARLDLTAGWSGM